MLDWLADYGSPGWPADYRRQFERTAWTAGEDPSNFAIALETLAVKAFGDMGQMARLHIIRDRFISGHDSCELRRHLDSVSPETPIWDIVDRCRVWESHADYDTQRLNKPEPDRALPIYAVDESGCETDDRMVAVVTTSQTVPDQLETLLRRLLPSSVALPPPLRPVPSTLEQLLQRLLAGAQAPKPAPPANTGSSDIEFLLQSLLPRTRASAARTQRTQMGPMKRDWAMEVCFSCGKRTMAQPGVRT